MLVRMNDELRARGIRFLVAMPPNAATIYQEDLPLWAQNPGKPTEYDMLLADLAAKGVTAVDLRPAVKAGAGAGPVFYMHDTHWTFRGALAAYNAVVEADAHPDWRIEPAAALGLLTLRKGGDLARMLRRLRQRFRICRGPDASAWKESPRIRRYPRRLH